MFAEEIIKSLFMSSVGRFGREGLTREMKKSSWKGVHRKE